MTADVKCEQLVVGTFLSRGVTLQEWRDALTQESFTDPQCRELFTLATRVADKGLRVDIITVHAEACAANSPLTVDDIITAASFSCVAELDVYINRLQELEARRRLALVGQKLLSASADELEPLDEVMNNAREDIDRLYRKKEGGVRTLKETVQEVNAIIDANRQGGVTAGTPTGFHFIDASGGLHEGDLTIVAGATSQGKTSFALSVALNAATDNTKVVFYSLEMTRKQLSARLMAMRSGVASSSILYKPLSDIDLAKVEQGIGKLPLGAVYFDDNSTSRLDNILASIRVMATRYGVKGAVVDYLQILTVTMQGETSKEMLMAEAARRLKNLAVELNIWIIALSQLSRDKDNPVPSLDRLRGSGQIAEAADNVLLVYRPEVYGRPFPSPYHERSTHNAAMIEACKGRNVGIGQFICTFIPELTMFTDEEPGRTAQDQPGQGRQLRDPNLPF